MMPSKSRVSFHRDWSGHQKSPIRRAAPIDSSRTWRWTPRVQAESGERDWLRGSSPEALDRAYQLYQFVLFLKHSPVLAFGSNDKREFLSGSRGCANSLNSLGLCGLTCTDSFGGLSRVTPIVYQKSQHFARIPLVLRGFGGFDLPKTP